MTIKNSIRPYTPNQVRKLCISISKEFKIECPDIGLDEAAYVLAQEFLSEDERVKAYFEKSKLRKDLWVETLSDYFM